MGERVERTPEIEARILEGLADGMSAVKISDQAGMPHRRTIERWMETDDAFAAECARARLIGLELQVEAIEDIERDTLAGTIDPRAASVVISSKQWRLSKLRPKKYGDRVAVDVAGSMSVSMRAVTASDDELLAIARGQAIGKSYDAGPEVSENTG